VVLSSFVAPFSTSALGVSLPLVARDLGAASVDSVEALVALTLAVAMFVLPLGRAADLLGHVVVFRMGLLLAVAGFALASLSPNFLLLCGALAVGGVGLAAVFGSNNALLFQAVAPDRRASAVGINSMSVYLGLLTGPFLGGFLAQVSWRVVFLPALALLLASVVLAGGPSPRQGRGGESFDWVGAALLALSLALVVLGVSAASPLFTGLGLAALVFTSFYESRQRSPVVDVGLFRSFVFSALLIAAFLSYLSTAALTPALSLLFQEEYGMTPQDAGMLLGLQALAMAISAPLAGRLSDKTSPSAVSAGGGAALLAASLFAYSHVALSSPSPHLLFLMGVGFAFFTVPNTTLILMSVLPARRGTASALVAEARVVGQSLSNAVAVNVLRSYSSLPSGVSALLLLLSAVAVAAAVLSAARYIAMRL
jgi:DHA2 family multidrug resistance protein-like MFS transporter